MNVVNVEAPNTKLYETGLIKQLKTLYGIISNKPVTANKVKNTKSVVLGGSLLGANAERNIKAPKNIPNILIPSNIKIFRGKTITPRA